MSKKRWIDTKFWCDVWVVDELNPLDRYLFLYFLTNDKTNVAGIYEISLRTISYETGIEKEEILRMMKRLESRLYYSQGWVVLRKAIKNQNYKNAKIKAAIEAVLESCPGKLLRQIECPYDWIPLVVKKETELQQMETDESSKKNDESYMTHDDSSHSDSDLESELDLYSDSTNVEMETPRPSKTNKKVTQSVQKGDPVSTLYYQAVKSLGLPTLNHNTLRVKITAMKGEDTEDELIKYLTFMRDEFASVDFPYKPSVTSALHIYEKRLQIIRNFERAIKEQQEQPRAWRPKTA